MATFGNNYPHNGLSILLGNGDGTFQNPVLYASSLGGTALATADFNDDGNPDLLLSSFGGVYILFGNRDGTFGPPTLLNGGGNYAVTGDFNGDGIPDLLTQAGAYNFNPGAAGLSEILLG